MLRAGKETADAAYRVGVEVQENFGGLTTGAAAPEDPLGKGLEGDTEAERVEEGEQRRPVGCLQNVVQVPFGTALQSLSGESLPAGFRDELGQGLEVLAVLLDEVAVELAEVCDGGSRLEDQRWRARGAVVVPPRPCVSIEVNDPTIWCVLADLAGEGNDVLVEDRVLEDGCGLLADEEGAGVVPDVLAGGFTAQVEYSAVERCLIGSFQDLRLSSQNVWDKFAAGEPGVYRY